MDKLTKFQNQFNRVIPKQDERYLNTLKNYIDDKTFNEKLNILPKLTSAVVKRLEKAVNSDEQKARLYNNVQKITEKSNRSKDKFKSLETINRSRDFSKTRHLIFDNDNNHSDFSKVEEALENKTKVVTNPIKVFLQETNEKVVQQALGMIVENVFRDRPKRSNNKNTSNTANENNTNLSTVNETNLNTSNLKTEVKQEDMLWFKKKCESIGIVTLEQKLDLYHIYHENNMIPKTDVISLNSGKLNKVNVKQIKKPKIEINSNTNIPTVESRQLQTPTQKGIYEGFPEKTPTRSKTLTDLSQKYLADLKNKFKIVDESFLQNKILDQFYHEVVYKAKISKENMKTFDNMSNIEKIRCVKNHKEFSSSKCIIKEIDFTPEKFIYFIFKRTIDFRILNHLNLNKTYIGDIGCSYILYLLDQHSKYLTYLNLSYTKLGKGASEFLSGILSKNTIKLTSLNISGNQLGDKVFCEICLGISKNENLTRLFSFDNNLGKTSAMILGTLLKYDKKIKLLDLSKNYFNQYIYNIFKGLIMNTTLEVLTLRECEIENFELKSLSATLTLNHTLKELYLDSNKFTNQASILISNILNSNHSIEIFSILGNKIDIEGVEEIVSRQKLIPIKIWNKTDFLKQQMDNNIESIIYEYF